MRNLKKILALVLALMMTLSLMVTASASSYTDVTDKGHEEAIEVMSGLGVFSGTGSGKFNPDGNLKRDQAAKIITYMLLGKSVADTLPNESTPFSDVKSGNWAAGSITYCANEGIIAGVGGGRFSPNGKLTGYQFAKMVLIAVGAGKDYTGSNWSFNVALDAKKAGILEGLEGVALSAPLTRAQAAQMAFNGLNYSPEGSSSVYVVKDSANSNAVVYRGTDALTALIMQQSNSATYKLSLETTNAGSVGDLVYNLTESTATDEFGRESKTWINSKNPDTVYASIAPTASKTYTDETTYGKIVADLGATSITFTKFDNTDNGTSVGAKSRTDTADGDKIGGKGTLIEVYKKTATTADVIIIDTYAKVLGTNDITPANAATGAKASITLEAGLTYDTDAFKAGDVVLYTKSTVGSTTPTQIIVNVVKAPSISGSVTATATDYIRVNGAQKFLSAHNINSVSIGVTDGYKYVAGGDEYTYYLDSYGNIIAAVQGLTAPADVNYIYVIATAAKAATSTAGDNLFTPGAGSAAVAQAKVMDLSTGEVKVVNQGVVKGTDNKYYYADTAGAASGTEVTDKSSTSVGDIYIYTKLADGSIVLGDAAADTSISLTKNTALVVSGATNKFANASTKVTIWEYEPNFAKVSKTEYVGMANFPAVAFTDSNALVLDSNNVVSSIVVVKSAGHVTTPKTYAVYAGLGELGADGQAYAFYVNGEKVNYYLASTLNGNAATAGITGANATPGAVVTVELTGGKLGASAVAAAATAPVSKVSGTVSIADPSYVVVSDTAYYYGKDVKAVDSTTFAVTTIAKGDTVDLYVDASNVIQFAVVTHA